MIDVFRFPAHCGPDRSLTVPHAGMLPQSYHRGDFTLNGASLTGWPHVLSNTLTLQMGTLTALRLSRNAIAELPPSAPKFLCSLTELDLRNNVLTALPGTVRASGRACVHAAAAMAVAAVCAPMLSPQQRRTASHFAPTLTLFLFFLLQY